MASDTSAEERLQHAFAAVICEADAPARAASDLAGFLAERGVTGPDLDDLAGRGERLLMYRSMIHSRLRGVIAEFLPRTAAHLGKPRLRAEVAAFMAERAPRSFYFRDVPGEFVDWAEPRWRAASDVPAFLADLAVHEWLDGEIANDPAGGEPPTGRELALDAPVALDGTAALRRYAFSVHRHDGDDDDTSILPAPGAVAVLAYRDRTTHKPRYLELTPRAAAVCERLLAGQSLQSALVGACEAVGEQLSDEFLAGMAAFLADLGERGVLLGAASEAC
jgi:hypothetical protein